MNEPKGSFTIKKLKADIDGKWGPMSSHSNLLDVINIRSELMEKLFDACMKHCNTEQELFTNISLVCQEIAMLPSMQRRRPVRKQGGTCDEVVSYHSESGEPVRCGGRTTKAGRLCNTHRMESKG